LRGKEESALPGRAFSFIEKWLWVRIPFFPAGNKQEELAGSALMITCQVYPLSGKPPQ
jgi:hypothetical protein